MKVLINECKKIFNIRLLIVAALFTFMFYDSFLSIRYYPSSDFGADVIVANRLKSQVGTTISVNNFEPLEKLRSEYISKINEEIQKSDILKDAGITTYKQMKKMRNEEDIPNKIEQEIDAITFQKCGKESFSVQQIDGICGDKEAFCSTKQDALNKVKYFYSKEWGYSKSFYGRMTKIYTMKSMSLLPHNASFVVEDDIPMLIILMLITCILFIIPFQIRDTLSNVNILTTTTKTGRKLWTKKFFATILMSFIICCVQALTYCVQLAKIGVLDFAEYPTYGDRDCNTWFNINFGTYIFMCLAGIILLVTSAVAIFYLISRFSPNYIVGIVTTIPVGVLLGMLFFYITRGMLWMEKTRWEIVYVPALIAIEVLVTVGIGIGIWLYDKRRDVLR